MTNERYKMIPNLREEDFSTKQEGDTLEGKNSKGSSSTSTPWSRLKDPRIVRVSRAFGGKDRHSKVCTVRGLRDRRIRLSVPTAIQLYDLQDRLGLNQPSKVVDWLLNAAKAEIDELPPLQIPPGSFGLNHQQLLTCHDQAGALQSNKLDGIKINNNVVWDAPLGTLKSNFWNLDAKLRNKSKEIAIETGEEEEENWNQRDVGEKPVATENHGENVSSINFFPVSNHSSLLNNPMLYHSYYRLDPSNFPLHQVGRDEIQNFNVVPFPSTLSQVRVGPPGTAQSYFPSHFATSSDIDPKK